jgi:signal peptidase I
MAIPWIVGWSLTAMFATAFLGDTVVLRTGSMEPTIIGRRSGGERVLISRVHAQLQEPERFDILLFLYPNNLRTEYLKRVVGMPGEQLIICGGDLYVLDREWAGSLEEGLLRGLAAIVRKPVRVQEPMLEEFPVIAPEELEDMDENVFRRHCEAAQGDAEAWEVTEGSVVYRGSGLGLVRLRRPARDLLPDHTSAVDPVLGVRSTGAGEHHVADLSLRLEVRPAEGARSIVLEIEDPSASATVRAEIAVEGSGARTRVFLGDRELGSCDVALDTDSWTSLRFDNVDDRVRLLVDGDPVLVRDFGHVPVKEGADKTTPAASVRFGAEGVVAFRPLGLYRDIFYVAEGLTRFLIPDDHYVFIGDNTASSADSRAWSRVAIRVRETGEILHGDSQGVTASRLSLMGQNPWQEKDGTWIFADVLGNEHRFRDQQECSVVASWPTPYVPKRWILGRIMCTLPRPSASISALDRAFFGLFGGRKDASENGAYFGRLKWLR